MDRFTEESILDLARNFRLSHEPEPEPFFAIAQPCEDCGRQLEEGKLCACQLDDAPALSRCPLEYQILMAAKTVGELRDSVKAHRLTSCPFCNPVRKEAGRIERRWEKAA